MTISVLCNGKRTIQKHYLSPKTITYEHVVACLGVDGARDVKTVLEEQKKLQILKKKANCFFAIEIKRMMRDEARKRFMVEPETGHLLTKFKDIGREFAVNLNLKSAEVLFHTCYGVFDMTPSWAWHLEKKFMDGECLQYASTDTVEDTLTVKHGAPLGTGLQAMIHCKKTDMVKLVMRKASRRHGFYIMTRRTPVKKGDKMKRRKKGVFLKQYIVRKKKCPILNGILTSRLVHIHDLLTVDDVVHSDNHSTSSTGTDSNTNSTGNSSDKSSTGNCSDSTDTHQIPGEAGEQSVTPTEFHSSFENYEDPNILDSDKLDSDEESLFSIEFPLPQTQTVLNIAKFGNKVPRFSIQSSKNTSSLLESDSDDEMISRKVTEEKKSDSAKSKKKDDKVDTNAREMKSQKAVETLMKEDNAETEEKHDEEYVEILKRRVFSEYAKKQKESSKNKNQPKQITNHSKTNPKRRGRPPKNKIATEKRNTGKTVPLVLTQLEVETRMIMEKMEDCIVEIKDIFEGVHNGKKELFLRLKWYDAGWQEDLLSLVMKDDPEIVVTFLAMNEHLDELVKEYSKGENAASLENHKAMKATVEKEQNSKKAELEKKNDGVEKHCKRKPYRCPNDHFDLNNMVAETRKSYFQANNKYSGVTCAKCQLVIIHANAAKPVYCCNNERQGCLVCVCSACIRDILKSVDTSNSSKKTRHSKVNS